MARERRRWTLTLRQVSEAIGGVLTFDRIWCLTNFGGQGVKIMCKNIMIRVNQMLSVWFSGAPVMNRA